MLLGRNNEVLLSDFGLVLIAQSSRSLTTKEMAGTVGYMAPEQFGGKPRAASDQYALGVVVYEWLCGTRPFTGSYLEIAFQHQQVLPWPLRERVPTISAEVEDVVLRALAKDPRRRFASVRAFATALDEACQVEPGGHAKVPKGKSQGQHSQSGSSYWTRRGDAVEAVLPSDSRTIRQGEQDGRSNKSPTISAFLFNQPLSDPGEFYGRIRERETLINRTRNGASTSIVGPRRVGKTWLMSYLKLVAPRELGTRFLVGYLDATTSRCSTLAGFIASSLEALAIQKPIMSDAEADLV